MFDYTDTRVRVFFVSPRVDIDEVFDDSENPTIRNSIIQRIDNHIVKDVTPDAFEKHLLFIGVRPVGDTLYPDDDCYEWAGCNQFNVYTHTDQHEKDWLKF